MSFNDEYIQRSWEVIGPAMPKIEARFEDEQRRFLALVSADHSMIGHVLKYHLVLEAYLNRYLAAKYGSLAWEAAELRFAQKAKLLFAGDDLRLRFLGAGVTELNRIRNRFGHRLESTISLHDVPAMLQVLKLSRPGKTYVQPEPVIADFVATACTFLSSDAEIEAIFRRASEYASGSNPT